MATPDEGERARVSRFEQARHPENRQRRAAGVLALLELGEDAVHLVVAVFLMAAAVLVLYQYGHDFLTSSDPFTVRVTSVINGLLFVVIVMELLHTVVEHFEFAGLQLKPFLIIGIISAVRHILTVGARESLGTSETTGAFRQAQIALGVNAAVVLALVVGLILVRRTDSAGD
jgi:uncharacterized membrane protein (DUF373 family)